jgi:hypothetical protein
MTWFVQQETPQVKFTVGFSTHRLERDERGLDCLAMGLKPWGQDQAFAKVFRRLIHCKPGAVSGQFEQNATWLAEVN